MVCRKVFYDMKKEKKVQDGIFRKNNGDDCDEYFKYDKNGFIKVDIFYK